MHWTGYNKNITRRAKEANPRQPGTFFLDVRILFFWPNSCNQQLNCHSVWVIQSSPAPWQLHNHTLHFSSNQYKETAFKLSIYEHCPESHWLRLWESHWRSYSSVPKTGPDGTTFVPISAWHELLDLKTLLSWERSKGWNTEDGNNKEGAYTVTDLLPQFTRKSSY